MDLNTLENCCKNCIDQGFPLSEEMKQEFGTRAEFGSDSITVLIDEIVAHHRMVHVSRGGTPPAGKPTQRHIPPKPTRRVESPNSRAARLRGVAEAATAAGEAAEAAEQEVEWCNCMPLRAFYSLAGAHCRICSNLIKHGAFFLPVRGWLLRYNESLR